MATETITAEQFPPGTSRYTVAMARCLGSVSPRRNDAPARTVVQALINLVQGRMLEYLADRICREYAIHDPLQRQRIVNVLLGILSDEFFALFRSTIDFQPRLVVDIARRILRKELRPEPAQKYPSPMRQPADRLYPALFRKYFEYRNLGTLLELLESDAQIQKIILRDALRRHLRDEPVHERILQILDDDDGGVATSLFMGYLRGDDVSVLVTKVRSGAWHGELQALHAHMEQLRGA